MLVDIKNINDVHTVKKPWGYEKWIADGNPNFSYALKEIFFKAPYRTSIQFHKFKEETNYVQSGKGILFYSKDPINIESFEKNEYSQESLKKALSEIKYLDGHSIFLEIKIKKGFRENLGRPTQTPIENIESLMKMAHRNKIS